MIESEPFFLRAIVAVAVCCLMPFGQGQVTVPSEVSALQDIKRSLLDPMNNLRNWNKGDPCMSRWSGVLCFNRTFNDGYLHVRELQLLNMNLSGSLAPALGQLSRLEILDFMWNSISGSIPKDIGNIQSLRLLLLNGNQLSGSLPEELGQLPNLNRIQIDQNNISGELPRSFANLSRVEHFHMNNNSISGQIPSELSKLPNLVHFLLDNNNLSGHLPEELASMPKLQILQLDNNNFSGTSIPASYGNMKTLLKLSLRNCSLQGPSPDFSGIPQLGYLDLSWNQLSGPIPTNKLSKTITTIDLSHNSLNGSIPSNFSGFPLLQKLSLANNLLSGSVPSSIWKNTSLNGNRSLIFDFKNNKLSNISDIVIPPPNVTVTLQGNPFCGHSRPLFIEFCGPVGERVPLVQANFTDRCPPFACHATMGYEYVPKAPNPCTCAAPIRVGYRLKSPVFSDFPPYLEPFENYLTSGLNVNHYQLSLDSIFWEQGPRLRMHLKFFPSNKSTFNMSEILQIRDMFTGWNIPDSDIFGPYELLNFTLLGPYTNVIVETRKTGIKTGALVGIIIGTVAVSVVLTASVLVFIMRRSTTYQRAVSKRQRSSNIRLKIEGVKCFTFKEMASATNNFNNLSQIGQGGYGKVYKGILADGTAVAIKRAQEGSLQGSKEFCTEIELLSRLHHRNLVSLIGYCDEEDEQMLVYEFMPNGTLRDHLSGKDKAALSFSMRLHIALGSARGILYLHTEADPPIFHRDVKTSNILLDSKFVAKVADFGLSRLAPVPDTNGATPGHVSTVVKGTPGYLDPEYFLTHKLTDRSDVYSLGVVFLELLTGMHPISHGKNIVREVSAAYESGMMFSMIDGRMGTFPAECIEKFIAVARRCCQDETDARPSMAEVVRVLENLCRMTPEVDAASSESISIPSITVTSSSSMGASNPYVSTDVSGSNLLSGAPLNITPR